MKISVVICTWNRPRSLARALNSLTRCMPPQRAAWQVVVVDNDGRDDTRRVIDGFADRLPLMRLCEGKQGQSHARNAAVAAVDTDYFLWTDDDVTVGVDWLRRYENGFDAHPEAALFGGPIRPCFEGTPPDWLRATLPLVAPAYAGLEPLPRSALGTTPRALPFGANLAIRGTEQRAFRYDPELGRRPGVIVGGEESDVVRRIVAAGGSGVWVPDAVVHHWIDPERQSVRYLRRYYTGLGYTGARRAIGRGRAMSVGEQIATVTRVLYHEGVYHTGRLLGRPCLWVRAMKTAARLHGTLLAHRAARSRGTTPT